MFYTYIFLLFPTLWKVDKHFKNLQELSYNTCFAWSTPYLIDRGSYFQWVHREEGHKVLLATSTLPLRATPRCPGAWPRTARVHRVQERGWRSLPGIVAVARAKIKPRGKTHTAGSQASFFPARAEALQELQAEQRSSWRAIREQQSPSVLPPPADLETTGGCHKAVIASATDWNQSPLQRNRWWLGDQWLLLGGTSTQPAPQTELHAGKTFPAVSIQSWSRAKAEGWLAPGLWQRSPKQSQENCHAEWKPKITRVARTCCKALVYLMNYL